MRAIGSGLGSGGFIVYDDTACMLRVAHMFAKFLWLEYCNQCSSCKVGTNQSMTYLQKLIEGGGDESDIDFVIEGAMMAPRESMLSAHRAFSFLHQHHPRLFHGVHGTYRGGCQDCRDLVLPKIHDFDEAKHTFAYSPGRLTP